MASITRTALDILTDAAKEIATKAIESTFPVKLEKLIVTHVADKYDAFGRFTFEVEYRVSHPATTQYAFVFIEIESSKVVIKFPTSVRELTLSDF